MLVIKLSRFVEIFSFSTPAPMVTDLADIARNATPSLIWRNVQTCITSFSAKNLSCIIKRKFIFSHEYAINFIL